MLDKALRFLTGEKELLLGLDIGTFSLKICKLRQRSDKYDLIISNYTRYEEPVIAGTEFIDMFPLASLIKATIRSHLPETENVAIHIPLALCFYTVISIPPSEDVEQNVINHVKGIITEEEIANVKIKYKVLPVSINENFKDVAIVAVKKEILEEKVNLIERAGFEVPVIDIEPVVLSNQFYLNYPERTAEAICLVDIGAFFTKVVVCYGGVPYTTRSVEIGSEVITEQLQKEFLLSYEDAERLKLGEDLKDISYKEAFKKVILKTVRKLSTEVMWAIDSFKDRFNKEVDAVFLYGGGSKQLGLIDEFRKIFKIEVEAGFPFSFCDLADREEFAVATGLGLRYKGDENVKV
jgi:type IV pilus assembly protein PilM